MLMNQKKQLVKLDRISKEESFFDAIQYHMSVRLTFFNRNSNNLTFFLYILVNRCDFQKDNPIF